MGVEFPTLSTCDRTRKAIRRAWSLEKILITYWAMNFFLIAVAALCTAAHTIAALECYSCEGQDGHACVTNPQATKTETCTSNQQCYSWRREEQNPSGSSVSMKRGCGQSVIATASSTGSSGVSVSSQSCSTDLCNADNAVQSFNLNNFNDFLNSLSNFNAPSYSGPYPIYPTYSAFPSANTGAYPGPYPGYYPGNYPLFGNYAPVRMPDQSALLAPFYNIIASALKYQWPH